MVFPSGARSTKRAIARLPRDSPALTLSPAGRVGDVEIFFLDRGCDRNPVRTLARGVGVTDLVYVRKCQQRRWTKPDHSSPGLGVSVESTNSWPSSCGQPQEHRLGIIYRLAAWFPQSLPPPKGSGNGINDPTICSHSSAVDSSVASR